MQLVGVLAIVLIAVLTSCTKGNEQTKGEQHMTRDWKFTLPQGNATEGRKVFVEAECFKCHEVKGEAFPAAAEKGKGVGPELSQMAGMHPPEFFAESIINPNAAIDPDAKKLGYVGEDGKSKMPDYDSVLTIKQVADLASYIASLKGQKSHEQMGH